MKDFLKLNRYKVYITVVLFLLTIISIVFTASTEILQENRFLSIIIPIIIFPIFAPSALFLQLFYTTSGDVVYCILPFACGLLTFLFPLILALAFYYLVACLIYFFIRRK